MVSRERVVPAATAEPENKVSCVDVGADANMAGKRRRRFAAHRLDDLLDGPRPAKPRRISDQAIADAIRLALEITPPGATHYPLTRLANVLFSEVLVKELRQLSERLLGLGQPVIELILRMGLPLPNVQACFYPRPAQRAMHPHRVAQ